jgi:hypothetical protein
MAEFKIKAASLRTPGAVLQGLGTRVVHRVVLERDSSDFVEFDDALFRLDTAVLLPEGQDPSAETPDGTGRVRTGVGLLAACLRFAEEHPDRSTLVAGHTDTYGTDWHNDELSRHRAAVVFAALTGDRALFAKSAHGPHLSQAQKDKLYPDETQVLEWVARERGWPCSPAAHPTLSHAVLDFQKSWNQNGKAGNTAENDLALTAVFNEPTWGAVYDCYQERLLAELGTDTWGLAALRARLTFIDPGGRVGCGEYHPIDRAGIDGYKSQTNRRVEVHFVDKQNPPALPCATGGCTKQACTFYDPVLLGRRHLPAMLSAAAWTAAWEGPAGPAQLGSRRTMKLEAPGLPAGTPITFVVSQIVGEAPPQEIARLAAQASEGGAALAFGDWFRPERVLARVKLPLGGAFAQVSFTFAAEGAGRRAAAQPVVYGDRLEVTLSRTVETTGPLAQTDCLVLGPWGSLAARTDDAGKLDLPGLPPGGVVLQVDGRIVHVPPPDGGPIQ